MFKVFPLVYKHNILLVFPTMLIKAYASWSHISAKVVSGYAVQVAVIDTRCKKVYDLKCMHVEYRKSYKKSVIL